MCVLFPAEMWPISRIPRKAEGYDYEEEVCRLQKSDLKGFPSWKITFYHKTVGIL